MFGEKMTRKQKRLKRKVRGKVHEILDGDYDYHKAKDLTKRKTSEHIYDCAKTSKQVYQNALNQYKNTGYIPAYLDKVKGSRIPK